MAEANQIVCPHCSAVNNPLARFCESCGMALPSLTPTGPRIISGKLAPQTQAGQRLQSDELLRTARQAARSLLSIGIINLFFGALNISVLMSFTGNRPMRMSPYFEAVTASSLIAGSLYIGMFFWAKYSPLSATIIGLFVYVINWITSIYIQRTLFHGTNANPSVTNYGFLRILMVLYLIRGVAAAIKHRKLEMQQGEEPQPLSVLPID